VDEAATACKKGSADPMVASKKFPQIAGWLIAMALALGIAVRLWSVAFPVAAVPFPLERGDIETKMAAFLGSMGVPVGQYRSAVRFDEETGTKNYIERVFGPARLAEAARDGVEIWFWSGRWFKPEQHEEFRVSTDQSGYITGFTHIIEEERALPTLTEGQARALAETFLRQYITQHPLPALHYLESGSEQKPHRTDYTFTWEEGSLRLGDAPYRLNVTVLGNEIGAYGEYLKVPEAWTVSYERQRAVNDLCFHTAMLVFGAIALGLAIVFLLAIRNHRVRWRDAMPWGWVVVIGIVGAVSWIDGVPDIVFGYSTTQQWQPFVIGTIFTGAGTVFGEVLLFWVLLLMADSIYREWLPGKPSFRRAFGRLALQDGQTVRAMGVGIAFAMFSVAYVCVFYSVGQRLGVWCPVEVDLSKTMSGPIPWIEGMQTGLSAAFTEEMIFRVGALLLFLQLLRVRWLAVLLSAAAWGFLHSNYPQMPGYTRGIELTIVGIVWGMLLLRYGVVATLTAHYLYDCWLGSLITFQSGGWENKVGAIAVSVWPVAFFLWGAFRKGPVLEPEEPFAPAKVAPPPPATREWRHEPLGLGSRGIAMVFLGCAVGLAVVFFLPRPQRGMEKLGKLDLSRAAILEKADAVLKARGFSPEGYRRVTTNYPPYPPSAYLLEHGNLDRLAELCSREWPGMYWRVRYFRFLQPEELTVQLDGHGGFLTWGHKVLREAPGAELDEPAALAEARNALATDPRIDLTGQELIRETPIQQDQRRDWLFGFDQKDFGWGDAKLRTYIQLQGDAAMNLIRFVKVPDAWMLEHEKMGWKQLVSGEFKHGVELVEFAIVGVLLILAIQKHLTPWRKAFLYALFPLGIKLVQQCNEAQQFYEGYDTTVPQAQYLITELGSRAESLLMTYMGAVLVIAVSLGFLHWAWGWTPEQLRAWPAEKRERGMYWWDTLLVAFASMVGLWVLGLVNLEVLGHFWPAEAATIHYWSVEEWMPWIGAVTESLHDAFTAVIRLAITASVLRLIWGRYPRTAWALLLLLPVLDLGAPETLGGFVWGLAYAEATLLVTSWLVLRVWRFNVPAVFLTYAMSSLWESVSLFVRKGGPVYGWQAAPLVGLMVVGLVMVWWACVRGNAPQGVSEEVK